MAGKMTRQNTLKPGSQPNAPRLMVIKPVIDRFAALVDYHNYRFLKKSSHYNNDLARELKNTAKEIAVQMNNCKFVWKGHDLGRRV